MFVPFLRGSRFLRALVLTTGVFSFLLWLYIVMRIVFTPVDMGAPFIRGVVLIPIWVLGALAFAVSFLSTFLYLWLWGRFPGGSMGSGSHEPRGP